MWLSDCDYGKDVTHGFRETIDFWKAFVSSESEAEMKYPGKLKAAQWQKTSA